MCPSSELIMSSVMSMQSLGLSVAYHCLMLTDPGATTCPNFPNLGRAPAFAPRGRLSLFPGWEAILSNHNHSFKWVA